MSNDADDEEMEKRNNDTAWGGAAVATPSAFDLGRFRRRRREGRLLR